MGVVFIPNTDEGDGSSNLHDIENHGGTGSVNDRETGVVLPTTNRCVSAIEASNTGTRTLTATLDLREGTTETKRVSIRLQVFVPPTALNQQPSGFNILRWGTGASGTLTLKYLPVAGGTEGPHVLVASVAGDATRSVTCPIHEYGRFIQVFLEYDGTSLTLVVGSNADQLTSTTEILPVTSPNTLTVGADAKNFFFMNLEIYNAALIEQVLPTATNFPYMLWDNPDSGVIAVLPTPTVPDYNSGYFTFLDRGYTAGHFPAVIDLTTGDSIATASLVVNGRSTPLGFTGGSLSQLLTWITNNSQIIVPFDGKKEIIKATVSGNKVTLAHKRGTTLGQMSFSVALTATKPGGSAVTGADWGHTFPILGKIPQPWALPHTGEPNKGVSILGVTNVLKTPKGIQMEYRDDNVRTVGKIIGNTASRPGSGLALDRLAPTNFFGSEKAPFPPNALIYGNPNALADNLSDDNLYAYGLVWERFMSVSPGECTMKHAPYNRSRSGYHFGGFSIDIPLGQTLRGVDICFTAPPPGLRGNVAPFGTFYYEWGEGKMEFGMSLNGNTEYTCLFYLLMATDADATKWIPIPSLGVDAIKVSGATTWKEIQFKQVDFDSLKDENDLPLLMGARRVHFKLVLAQELGGVNYTGLSYKQDPAPKK